MSTNKTIRSYFMVIRTSNRKRIIHVQKSFSVLFCFCFVYEITRESEKCNLMEACTNSASGDRNFLIALIGRVVNDTYKKYRRQRYRHLTKDVSAIPILLYKCITTNTDISIPILATFQVLYENICPMYFFLPAFRECLFKLLDCSTCSSFINELKTKFS